MRNNHIKIFIAFAVLLNIKSLYSQELYTMESEILKTERGTIEYTLQGKGNTVIIIHGGNDNCFTDIKQQHLIDNSYQVLIPSRPGYGKTSSELGKTAAEQADFIKLLLDSLKIERVAILTHSAGGAVALEFAKKYQDYTVCLILEDAITKTWIPKFTPTYLGMKYVFQPKRQSKLWNKMLSEYKDNQTKHLLRLCKMFSTLKPEFLMKEWGKEGLDYYEKSLYSSSSGCGFLNDIDHKAKDIHLITAPTLISHSPFDKNVPFSHALYANKKIKNSQIFIAPVKSHLIYMENDSKYILDKRISFLRENYW